MATRKQLQPVRMKKAENFFFTSRTEKIMAAQALLPPEDGSSDMDGFESDEENYILSKRQDDPSSSESSVPPSLTSSMESLLFQIEADETDTISFPVDSGDFTYKFQSGRQDNVPQVIETTEIACHELNNEENPIVITVPPPDSVTVSPSLSNVAFSKKVESDKSSTSTKKRKIQNKVGSRVLAKKVKNTDSKKCNNHNYSWKNEKFQFPADFMTHEFSIPEFVDSPINYFKKFFSEDLFDMIIENTNLYSTQETGKSVNLTKSEFCDFLAIKIIMGIVKMPAYTDYWSHEFRYDKVANLMSLKRYQQIRRFLHFVDNNDKNDDLYFKIRKFIEKLRRNCLAIANESRFSVDEMMVPYKGTRAGSRRQYLKNKPKKWGFKIFIRAGVSGFIYDFLVYGGEDTFRFNNFSQKEESMGLGAKVVIALCKSIPNQQCNVVYFDNFFTSIELVHHLREEYGIFSLGTIRSNRLRGCEEKLSDDKTMKKKGRGNFSQAVCNDARVAVVKWFDNKSVILASSYVDAYPVENVKRFSREEKRKVDVTCPQIVKHYNCHMGGVDLADMLIALYRTNFRCHRWYLHIFSQMLDICVNNAWLLFKRESSLKLQPTKMTLKQFRFVLYESITKKERRVGRPSNTDKENISKIKKPVAPRPLDEVRKDRVDHFPVFVERGRCKFCTDGQTTVQCEKCQQRLCFVVGLNPRNCFYNYHK
ncbi:hypothetical protein LSTR_LSTR000292 [Laodelphax striatellus]|uniref:PiggyBac transposable element-derived protein domain-containing protein n=1 Tax=Laodelphax striatellus TaxID=195883 RepID=A0A482X7Y2_LAOST|nr:hypothetical protein LSTR_LSTR000292 [Laodelphax striatellus]